MNLEDMTNSLSEKKKLKKLFHRIPLQLFQLTYKQKQKACKITHLTLLPFTLLLNKYK